MNYARLRDRIKEHEGYRELPYRDHLGNWTVGYGHLIHQIELRDYLPDRILGLVLDRMSNPQTHDRWLDEDIQAAIAVAERFTDGTLSSLTNARQEVLIEMGFQLGNRLHGFRMTKAAVMAGRPREASEHMLDSRWAQQTPNRARKLAQLYLAG